MMELVAYKYRLSLILNRIYIVEIIKCDLYYSRVCASSNILCKTFTSTLNLINKSYICLLYCLLNVYTVIFAFSPIWKNLVIQLLPSRLESVINLSSLIIIVPNCCLISVNSTNFVSLIDFSYKKSPTHDVTNSSFNHLHMLNQNNLSKTRKVQPRLKTPSYIEGR